MRRAALNPLFSRKMVLELQHVVQSKVDKLYRRLAEAVDSGKALDLHHGFRAVSLDIFTDYAFDDCYNLLDQDDFGVGFFSMMRGLGPGFWFFQLCPWIQPAALNMPLWLAKILSKSVSSALQVRAVCPKFIWLPIHDRY
jgi:hypothetical protein